MRRYKRILAIVLAASLAVGGFATPDSIKASSVAGIENTTDESTDDDSMHTDTDQQEKVSDHNAVDNEEKTDEIDKEENDGKKDDTKENDTNENDTKENNTKDTVNTENTDTEDKKNNADKINTTESINTTEGINTTESINATECIGDINSTEYDAEQDDDIMLLDAGVSLEQLAADSINSGVTWMADSNTIKATLKGFVLLSNCQPESLQNKKIIVESTGSSNITEEVEYNGETYKYAGIGTADCPFMGNLSAGQITTDTTLFGGISSQAKVNINLIWAGDGSKPFYAQQYVFADADTHSLFDNTDSTTSVTVSVADGKTIGSLIGTVSGQAGTLKIERDVEYPAKKEQIAVNSSENAGLICNTLEAGTIQLDGFSFPSAGYSVTANTGNAGGVIGVMKAGTALKADADTQISQLSVTANNGNAGGIVGEIAEGARLIADSGKVFELSAPSVTASGNEGCAGGIAGKATESDGTTILSPIESTENTDSKPFRIITPTVNGKNAGGLFGNYIIKSRQMNYPASVNLNMPTILTSGNGNGGGLFGVLDLQNTSSYTIDNFTFECTKSGNENNSTFGSLIGQVKGTGTANALYINNCNVKSAFNNNNTSYHGGLIGMVGGNRQDNAIYVEVNGGTAADSKIHVEVTNPLATGKFGGMIGCLSKGSILKMTGIVEISTTAHISQGGGIVGHAAEGSAVEFNGTTDLSEVKYAWDKTNEGQLIGRQESSLIYARGDGNGNGWKFIRTNAANNTNKELNDIGNYGEVIRLQADSNPAAGLDKELIKINAEHQIELKQAADYTGNSNYGGDITLASREGLALLAITLQTRGYFSADKTYIPANSWTELTKKNISLSADIDLTGTGILGIERDSENNTTAYTGTFYGNGKKITLAIGEQYGFRNNTLVQSGDWGSGQIYTNNEHENLGLFSLVSGNVSNLTIDGIIQVNSTYAWGDAGGYAGQLRGNSEIVNVTTAQSMNIKSSSVTKVGALFGENIGTSNIILTNFESRTVINIDSSDSALDCVGSLAGVYRDNTRDITISCNDVLIGTKISTTGRNIHAGGLIGEIPTSNNKRKINISKIQINGFEINNKAENSYQKLQTCGGVLGYLWENTDVVFHTPADADAYALSVDNSTINAPNAPVGGLVYQGSGKWQINDRGIDIKSATFNANTLGLLLCHAEETNNRALYLEMTADWATAYKLENVTVGGSPAVYDEMIAYTTDNAEHILDNNKNAIISLATDKRTGVDTAECNTYINRTEYGKKKLTNPNSRYYYNLDQIVASQNGQPVSGWLDTPEKLMIWNVYIYADESLKGYFPVDAGNIKGIGTDAASKAAIDLTGYSYYPVDVGAMTIQNADIKFANETIEEKEKSNKSTKGNNTEHTQHYAMHGGLFRNMISSEDATTTVEKVTFQGTIGKVNDASGVLSFGNIEGNAAVTPQRFHTLKFSKVEFSDFRVTDAGTDAAKDYAPILINQTGSYTTLVFNDVKAVGYGDNPGKPAGSSLLGKIGGPDKTQISLTFHKMKLPDKRYGNGGIFTHATFLESFQYKSGGIGTAIYNFYKAEDWNGTVHRHDVTYGSEISDSVEYENLQHWYYDEQTYGQSEGYVRYENPNDTGEPSFKDTYLPYVHTYDKQNKASHEIKVNQRIADLLEGCGTYGHPYQITTALEMKTIADYIATATPQTGWKVQVTGNQSAYHTAPADADSVYEYDGTGWYQVQKQNDTDDNGNTVESWQKTGKTVSNDMMHCYILSAYYDIRAKENTDTAKNKVLELENFAGLGTELYPFRGVVVSNNGSTVKIGGDNIANGFIVYSYGSVVKDITIQYSGSGKTLAYQAPDDYQPKSFFGGVIGCIMGGDNIIDNVKVSMNPGWTLVLDGEKKYLIQAGGYVGSVSGGGVIFRNINAKSDTAFTGLTANHLKNGTSLYVNPYVGRVLDGYAFSEGCVIDNGTQNYKINQLTDTTDKDITTNVNANNKYTVTIQNAQGLLLMSAIINSGAAGAGGTYAYYGTAQSYSNYKFGNGIYGKIRNASYQYVGKTDNKAAEDFKKSIKDDTLVPAEGNAPYLITKYSNGKTFLIAGYSNGNRNKVDFQLSSNSTYDMREYKNGYQGISARYLSNAVNAGSNVLGTVYVKPFVKGFNGNGSTIKVKMQMKEYAEDDFHGISFGGVFNLIWAAKATELTDKVLAQNLTIDDSAISLSYCNKDGTAISGDSNMIPEQGKYCVGVGGFAGNSAQNSLENASYVFQHIVISRSNFTGPISAGGLMGSAGLGNSDVNRGVGQLLNVSKKGGDNNSFGVNLVNCQYAYLSVTAKYAAGGMVGGLFCNQKGISFGTNDSVRSSVSVTEEAYKTVGKDSSIVINNTNTGTDTYAGGIFGAVATALYVNDENLSISDVYQNAGKTLYTACLQDITFINSSDKNNKARYAGGVVGIIQKNNCYVYHMEMKKSDTSDNVISGTTAAGGMIGYANISGKILELQNCRAENMILQDATSGLGGMIGIVEGDGSRSAEMKITGCISQGIHAAGSGDVVSTGGMVGLLRKNQPLTLQACIVLDSTIGSENNQSGYYGGFAGTITNTPDARLSIFDSELTNTKISGQYAGGIISAANGRIYGSNILLNQVSVAAGGQAGLIVGAKQSDRYNGLYMAGVSVKGNSTANNHKTQLTGDAKILEKGYIALADYEGTSMTAGNQNPTAGTDGLLGAEGVAPYVVTSPKNSMSVVDTDGTEKYLFGDSTSWSADGNTFKLEAQKILEEAGTQPAGKFVYKTTGVTLKSSENPNGFDFSTVFATYNQNQLEKAAKDFPVLIITGNESDKMIEKYLDIVTNGGYSQAKKLNGTNGTHVKAEAKVYNYNVATGKFIASSDTPALQMNHNGTKQMSFQADATDYDNQKNRFTLLTVTFAENGHEYHVQVPIIVHRVLEMDFTATLSYGTHFKADDYANLTGHILDSFGNAMTAYLTYAYNSSLGEVSAFGWQNYVDAGGDVTQAFAKSIEFHLKRGKIPAGTQLTLVDCQDKNRKAYFYTVTEEEEKQNRLEFLYSNFKASDGVTAYKDLSIGEVLEAKAEKSGSGKFIEVNADGKPLDVNGNIVDNIGTPASGISPTVKIGDRYYRLPQDGEDVSKLDKYTVTMDDHIHNENYYLVITFPETAGKEPINGYITTNVNGNIPMHLTDTLRQKNYNGKGQTDSHSDTASTFQISSGYTQSLVDQDQRNPARKEIRPGDSVLTVHILDTITFSNEQFYNSTDHLFLKFTGNLSIVTNENGTEKADSSQFPAGTKGKVRFYVYSKSGDHTTYYKYDSSTHDWKQTSVAGAAVEYPWISEGYHMELLLSEDGTLEKALNLQQIRSFVKGNNQSGNSTFYVEAVLEAELPAAGLDVIPAASLVKDMPEEYAKLGYLSEISTEKESLAYSSNRALLTYDQTNVKYYRNSSVKSTLTYDADDVNQLGINPYDLGQNLDRDKKNVIISTTAGYDLSMIPKMETLLRDSKEVRFSLTVSQKDEKDGNTENYKTPLTTDAKDYMDIKLVSPGASEVQFNETTGIWSWSIPKEVYWDELNSKLKTTDGVFDGDVFIQNLNLLVRLDNVEEKQHFYSNYKVELRAEIVDNNSNVSDQPNPESDYLIYTLAKIRPEFVE
ncbi:hypothetical protein MSB04_05945 [bacterium]|nr:hypothetical protein [bacterium]